MADVDRILGDLAELLRDFQGREYSGVIARDTLFFGELGFASIDAIVLGETLETKYGCAIPFQKFLAAAQQRGAEDIRVGELAEFLAAHLPAC